MGLLTPSLSVRTEPPLYECRNSRADFPFGEQRAVLKLSNAEWGVRIQEFVKDDLRDVFSEATIPPTGVRRADVSFGGWLDALSRHTPTKPYRHQKPVGVFVPFNTVHQRLSTASSRASRFTCPAADGSSHAVSGVVVGPFVGPSIRYRRPHRAPLATAS